MMKIAVIAHVNFAIRRPYAGGLEAHTHQMVNELVRQEHDVTLFAKAGSQTNARLVSIFRGNMYDGRNPLYNRSYNYAMKRIASSDYDLILNNSFNPIPLKRHSATMAPMITVFHTPPYSKMTEVLQSQLAMPNRTYIAVSDFTAEQWKPFCNDRIQVVPNGIDLDGWQADSHGPDQPSASWVGRITPEKAPHMALQACIAMGLPISFGGNIANKKYFRSHIKPLLRNKLVTYMGHVDRQQVNAIYKDSTVALITPVWDEPFGLVAVEALASGTPVAAFGRGGLRSVIAPQVGQLAEEDTVESLQAAIKTAMTKRRDDCITYAYDNFTLPRMVDAYLDLVPAYGSQEVESLAWATTP